MLVYAAASLLTAQPKAQEMTKLQVVVTNAKGKPVPQANVLVRFGDRKIAKIYHVNTQWEMRTSQEGVIDIPEIPQGSILVQVTAKGYQTFGQTFDIAEKERTIAVTLKPPQQQYSAHEGN